MNHATKDGYNTESAANKAVESLDGVWVSPDPIGLVTHHNHHSYKQSLFWGNQRVEKIGIRIKVCKFGTYGK